MKLSESWLREWVNPAVAVNDLADQLSMAGLEVDGVEPAAPPFSKIVVGTITELAAHPDADKLRVCQVDAGQEQILNIVCGAANAEVGGKYPVALIGAVLPGDFKIKKSKLRGVESQGMLCSSKELGVAEDADGLMPLPADAPIGADIREYLSLDDHVIEVDLTPNRGDCLSLSGVAREVGVINQTDLTPPVIDEVPASIDDTFPVELQAPADCPRYVGRVIRNTNPQAETPLWMQEKLRRSGIRSLGPSVDVTNYIMLELGQPMHAFDLNQLSGGIVVRRAKQGETLVLLNGEVVDLDPETLVIADHARVLAMAGIMGGEGSGVADDTHSLFLESAFFSPISIIGRSRSYGLSTDSAHRFERGVDPGLQRIALERATALLLDIVGGEAGPVIDVVETDHMPQAQSVKLREARIERVLGVAIERTQVEDILTRLGMELESTEDGWQVAAPTYRFDIAIEEDLIEELGRIYGYAKLPSTRPHAGMEIQARPEEQLAHERLLSCLVEQGYQEAITYSFVDPKIQQLLSPDAEPIDLANPISTDMAQMRTSLWPGLVQALVHNINRQQPRVRLFETGLRFQKQGDKIVQDPMIAMVACGAKLPEQWDVTSEKIDFFDIKGDLEALLTLGGSLESYEFTPEAHKSLHPGQCARISRDGELVGWVGALHPTVEKALGLKERVFVCEVLLSAVRQKKVPKFAELSKFPAIRRDLALVVAENIPSKAIIDQISGVATDLMRDLQLFDVYRGKGIEKGEKSLALGLTFQHASRNLTDSEVDAILEEVLVTLRNNLNARLRD